MVEQLSLFGTDPPPPSPSVAPSPEPPPAAVPPPLQAGLFEGPYVQLRAMEAALAALDATALRVAARACAERYPDYAPARQWPIWADAIETHNAAPPAVAASHALALERARFPGMPPGLFGILRAAALVAAHAGLLLAAGPAARLADGRAAGALLVEAGRTEAAIGSFQAAVAAGLGDGATRTALAAALWHVGRPEAGLAAARDALLLDPEGVPDDGLGCPPFLELLDAAEALELPGQARAWIPVLAEMARLVPLPGWVVEAPRPEPPVQVAALLVRCRQAPRTPAGDAQRVAFKRAIVALVPALRGKLREV